MFFHEPILPATLHLYQVGVLGLIQRVHQPGGCQAFCAACQGHQHLLLCQRCGRVTFFEGDDLGALFQDIAQTTGYAIHEHWLQLFGLCQDCQPIQNQP